MSKLKNYAEAVAAFAEGRRVQILVCSDHWIDWRGDKPPIYDAGIDFRVKPKPMGKLKNYAEAIMAFAEDKDIQVFTIGHVWEDWDSDKPPTYSSWDDFRVKPNTIRYRVAIVNSGGTERPYLIVEGSKYDRLLDFVRWHGDWFEV